MNCHNCEVAYIIHTHPPSNPLPHPHTAIHLSPLPHPHTYPLSQNPHLHAYIPPHQHTSNHPLSITPTLPHPPPPSHHHNIHIAQLSTILHPSSIWLGGVPPGFTSPPPQVLPPNLYGCLFDFAHTSNTSSPPQLLDPASSVTNRFVHRISGLGLELSSQLLD